MRHWSDRLWIAMLVRTAHASEFDLVCDTPACGFFDDPLFHFMFPDPARRAKSLPFFFAAYAELAREYGKLLLSEGRMGALVLYLPGHAPGGPHLKPRRRPGQNSDAVSGCQTFGGRLLGRSLCDGMHGHYPAFREDSSCIRCGANQGSILSRVKASVAARIGACRFGHPS